MQIMHVVLDIGKLPIKDVDAVHVCERKVQYVYSNVYERSRPI